MREKVRVKNMKEFENLKKEIEEGLSDYSFDFINDCRIEDNCYVSDSISEFANKNANSLPSDQRIFYYNNTDLCNNALIELGYDLNEMIKNGDSLDDLMRKAGVIGECYQIENIINKEIEDILKLLLINYIIENNIDCDIEVLDNINYRQIRFFSDLLDYLEEYLEEEE